MNDHERQSLEWKEANLLERLNEVRNQLAVAGMEPIDGPIMLRMDAELDDPRRMEQVILQKLREIRAEIAEMAGNPPATIGTGPASAPPDLLRHAVGAAPVWVMTVQSPLLTIIEANPTCTRLFGSEVAGVSLPSLLARGETALPDRIREALETGRSSTIENLALSMLSGEYAEKRHWSFFLFPWVCDQEAQGRVLVVGLDITESVHDRHWAEVASASRLVEAIEADQAQLESVLRHVPLAVALVDASSREVLFDRNLDQGLRARAFPAGLAANATPPGWTHLDGTPIAHAEWPVWRALAGETLHHELLRLSRADQGYRTFRVSGGPIHSASGQISSAAVVWDEITLQLSEDQQLNSLGSRLAAQEALLREVMEASPVGMVVHPCDGGKPQANSGAREIVGVDLAPIRPLLRPDGRPFAPEDLPLARALRGQVVAPEDAQRIGPSGTPVVMRLAARPVHNADGNVTHAIATYEDVSPQPGVNEFLANLSHELRTPMSSILGWIRLLADESLPAEKRTHGLAVIERNARLQMHLIEDLLDTSLLLTGRLPLNPVLVDPRTAVEQAVESILPLASLKGVSLSARVGPECSEVVLDPDRLHQVIWNLLANAIRFTGDKGQVNLRLSQSAGRLKIEVQDTGEGIEPSVLPYVFRRFVPSDSATSRRVGGLGLGLGLMKHLVDLQGGSIEAFSGGLGQGSTFMVALPTRPIAARAASNQDAGMGVARLPNLAGRTLLVVEDETDTRDLLKAVLQGAKARVVTAADGVDALRQMQTTEVDLVLSDLGMPARDGYDLIRLIRLTEATGAHLPAVALTARTREEDRSRALAAGFDVHVPKPIDPRQLVSLVASLLTTQVAAGGPPALKN